MQATRPAAGRFYRPELDVVRFLAFLLVFLHHVVPNSNDPRFPAVFKGYSPLVFASSFAFGFGLSLFFTLSAFLICELLLRERESTGTVHVGQFYIRRILRIWPLYYLGLAIGVAVAVLPGGDRRAVAEMGWFGIFMSTWYLASHIGPSSPMNPLWSISVEEQFYLCVPWISKYLSRKLICGFCIMLLLLSNSSLFYLGRTDASGSSIWFNSIVQFQCFAAGILLCLFFHGRVPKLALWRRTTLLVTSGACWFFACYRLHALFTYTSTAENPGSWPLIAGYGLGTLGCVLLIVAFLGIDTKLLPGWAIYLGRISFGLYVYHQLALNIAGHIKIGHVTSYAILIYILRIVLALGLDVLMAAVSYRYFEMPFLRMKQRHAYIRS
jgi:peptidoglycan/LPS O-acetylase OafA/YrhL